MKNDSNINIVSEITDADSEAIEQFLSEFDDSFFGNLDWLETAAETLYPLGSVDYLIGRSETGQISGFASFVRTRTRFLKIFHPRILALTGTHSVISPEHLDFLIDENCQTKWFEYLEKYLVSGKNSFDFIVFDSVAEGAENIPEFVRLIGKRGYRVISQVQDICRYFDLPTTFEELLDGYSSKKRRTIRSELRRNSGILKMVDYSELGSFEEMFETAQRLHNLARGKKGEAGSFDRKGYIDFHKGLVESMKGKAELYFRFIISGEEPIAFRYGFISDDIYYDYQTGYDPKHSKNRPGFLIVALTIQGLISKGVKKYDFLRGDHPYKKYWADKYRRTSRYYIFPPGLMCSFYYSLLKAYLRLK